MESPQVEVASDKSPTLHAQQISQGVGDGHNYSSEVLRELHNLFNTLFTKENIEADAYLQAHMNAAMVIPIAAIINLPRVRSITDDANIIRHALATSPAVTLIEDSVRPNFKVEQNTIILRDIASATSSDELLQLFKSVPSCPPVKSIRSDMNDTWFVAFHNEEAARAALLSIRNSTFNGKPIRARLKTESITKSYYSPRYRSGEGNAPIPHAGGPPPNQMPPEYFYRMQQGGGPPAGVQSPQAGVAPQMFYFPPNFMPPGSPMYMPMPPPHHWQQGPRGGGRHGKGSPRQGGVGGWASSPQSPRGTPMAISHKYPSTSSPREPPMQPMYMSTGQMPPPPHMVMMMPPPPHAYPPHMHPHQPARDDATLAPIPPHHQQHHNVSPPNISPPSDSADGAVEANRNKSAGSGPATSAGPKRNRSGSGVGKKKNDAPVTTPRNNDRSGGQGKKGGSGAGKGGGGRGNKGGKSQGPVAPSPAAEFNMEADFPALDNAPPGVAGSSPLTTASPVGVAATVGGADGETMQGSWAAAVKKRPSGGASNCGASGVSTAASVASTSDVSAAPVESTGDATTGRRPSKSITIIDPIAEGLIEHNSFGHYRPPTPVAPPLSPCTAREVASQNTVATEDVGLVAARSSCPADEVAPPLPNGSSNSSSPAHNSDNNSSGAAKTQDSTVVAPLSDAAAASSAAATGTSASSSSSGKVSFRDVVRRGKP